MANGIVVPEQWAVSTRHCVTRWYSLLALHFHTWILFVALERVFTYEHIQVEFGIQIITAFSIEKARKTGGRQHQHTNSSKRWIFSFLFCIKCGTHTRTPKPPKNNEIRLTSAVYWFRRLLAYVCAVRQKYNCFMFESSCVRTCVHTTFVVGRCWRWCCCCSWCGI